MILFLDSIIPKLRCCGWGACEISGTANSLAEHCHKKETANRPLEGLVLMAAKPFIKEALPIWLFFIWSCHIVIRAKSSYCHTRKGNLSN